MAKFVGPSGIELPADPTIDLQAATKQYVDNNSGGADTSGPYLIVASVDAPASVKEFADYVCTGSADQTTINSAITAAVGEGGRGKVQLTGGRFYLSNAVMLQTGIQLAGCGWITELRGSAHSASDGAWVKLLDNNVHATSVSDLWVSGNARHGVHGMVYNNTGGEALTYPAISPDFHHYIHNVMISYCGTSTTSADGLRFEGNTRVCKVSKLKVHLVRGSGVVISGSSDMHFVDCDVTTNSSGLGHGFVVDGADNKFTNCKAFYCSRDGWQISSSRNVLTNCAAQDNGQHGFHFTNTFSTVANGLTADSNGRLVAGDGVVVDGSNLNINVSAYDRGQTPGSPQRYGINFVSGTNNIITGLARLNATADVNGTPGAGSFVRIIRESGTIYEFPSSTPSSPVSIPFHFPIISTGVKTARFIAPFNFTLTSIRARVESGSGVACRAVVNGSNLATLSSIGTSVVSTTYNTAVTTGQVIQIEITSAGTSASDLSITLGGAT